MPYPIAAPLTVLVADDDAAVRRALAVLIGAQDDMELVHEAVDGSELEHHARTLRPDVAVVDLRMRDGGPVAVTNILAGSPETAVVVYTAYGDSATEASVRQAGAVGFEVKGRRHSDLVGAIRAAADRPEGRPAPATPSREGDE